MYEYLDGKLVLKSPTYVVIDIGGVGYHVHISLHTFSQLKEEERCRLFISQQIKEDAHLLFGFFEEEERRIFQSLLSVSGIGANTARMILSSVGPAAIQQAIVQGDVNLIKQIKGIGPKTAQRMILELQDKLKKGGSAITLPVSAQQAASEEAIAALLMLGFGKAQVEKVVSSLTKEGVEEKSVEELIKLSLKRL